MIRSGSVIGRASASTGPERSKVSRALSPSSKRCAATATGGCASSARAFMLARNTAAQATERAFCLAQRAAPRILMPFISAPDAAYLAPSRAEVNEMMRQACESARAWRGGHRRSRRDRSRLPYVHVRFVSKLPRCGAIRRRSSPAPPISPLLGGARINLDLQNRVSRLMDAAALDATMSPDDPNLSLLACAERPSGRPAPPRHPGEVPRSESRLEPGGNRHDGGASRRPLGRDVGASPHILLVVSRPRLAGRGVFGAGISHPARLRPR